MAKWWLFAVLVGWVLSLAGPSQAADPELHAGMVSGNELIADLEFIVSKQGQQPVIFKKKIQENIDPFLVGVDETLPVGVSIRFDEEFGTRNVFRIPVKDKKEFIEDNLDPSGISVDAVRGDKTKSLYKLTGDVIEEGRLRLYKDKSYGTVAPNVRRMPMPIRSLPLTSSRTSSQMARISLSTALTLRKRFRSAGRPSRRSKRTA